jgi:hypothetical protein
MWGMGPEYEINTLGIVAWCCLYVITGAMIAYDLSGALALRNFAFTLDRFWVVGVMAILFIIFKMNSQKVATST